MSGRAFLTVAALLFSIGVGGFLTRRNLLVIFLSIELMLNAAGLALLTFARARGGEQAPAHVVFFLMLALAAAESAVGLSLVIAVYRRRRAIDVDHVAELKG